MTKIDKRIVEMKFDNKQFERGVRETAETLERLKKNLNFDKHTASLVSLGKVGQSFSLANISSGVDTLNQRFSALGIVGITVLQDLTRSVLSFSTQSLRAISGLITEGGKQRALNIEQAKFQFRGLGMDVKAAMEDALYAVTDTAYGLDEAAVAASQLGASGVELGDKMKMALRAISGTAAMTNSSYSDISHIFTTVAGQGKVMTMQLRQIENRGINVAATMAKEMGTTEAAVRNMVTAGKIDFETFASAMDSAFGEHATKANETYSGSLANVKANLSNLGAQFQSVKIENMKKIFVELIRIIKDLQVSMKPVIDRFNEFQTAVSNSIISSLKNLDSSPLPVFVEAIGNGFAALLSIIKPIGQAFRDIFPPKGPEGMMRLVEGFRDLTASFKLNADQTDKVRRAFRGLFAIGDLVATVFAGIVKAAFPLVDGGGNILLTIAANIGDVISGFRDVVKESGFLQGAFSLVGGVISFASKAIEGFTNVLGGSFQGFVKLFAEGLSKAMGLLGDFLERLNFSDAADVFSTGVFAVLLLGIKKFLNDFKSLFAGGSGGIVQNLKDIMGAVTETFQTFQSTLKAKALLSIAGAIAILTASVVVLSTIDVKKLGKALGAISILFLNLFGTMAAFEAIMKGRGFAGMIRVSIALVGLSTAVLLLSAAVKTMGNLSWGELLRGLTGLAGVLAMVVGVSYALSGVSGRLKVSAVGLILFSAAITILARTVKTLGSLDLATLTKGLVGVGILLLELSIFMKATDLSGMGMLKGAGLLLFATGLTVMASAVRKIAEIDTAGVVRGLTAIGVMLLQVNLFMKAAGNPLKLTATAAGLVILGSALVIISAALKSMGGMTWNEIAKGLVMLAGSLNIIAVSLKRMTFALPGAAAVVVMAGALALLAPVLILLGNMSIGALITSLVALGGSLTIFGIAAKLLTPAIPAMIGLSVAVALLGAGVGAAGAGLALLATGFTAMAASGVAGVGVMIKTIEQFLEVVPMIAVGMVNALKEFIVALADASAELIDSFSDIIVAILISITNAIPQAKNTFVAFVSAMLDAAKTLIPQFIDTGITIINSFLKGLAENMGEMITLASTSIQLFLRGLGKESPKVVDAGIKMIIDFINGMADALRNNSPELAAAIKNLLTAMLQAGLAILVGSIPGFKTVWNTIMHSGFVQSIKSSIPNVIAAIKEAPSKGATAVKGYVKDFAAGGRALLLGLRDGIVERTSAVVTAAKAAPKQALAAVRGYISQFLTAGKDMMIGLRDGIVNKAKSIGTAASNAAKDALAAAKRAVDSNSPSLAFMELGGDMSIGMAMGITKFGKEASKASEGVATNVLNGTKKLLGIQSPSTVFRDEVGKEIGVGMAKGVTDSEETIVTATTAVGKASYEEMKNWIDKQHRYFELSLGDELSKWKSIQSKYSKDSEERLEIDKRISELQLSIKQQAFNKTKSWMDEEKYYSRLTLEEELSTWKEIQTFYKEGTDVRKEADREVYRLKKDIRKRDLEESIEKIEDEKFYNRMSTTQELEAWTKIQAKYKEGTDERKRADKEVYKLKEDLTNRQKQLDEDYYRSQKDINNRLRNDIESLNNSYDNALKNRTKAIVDSYGLFDKVEKNMSDPIDGSVLTGNLQDQVEIFKDWEGTLDSLYDRGLDDELYEELSAMGPKSLEQIKALNNMSDRELTKYTKLWKEKHRIARSQATGELHSLRVDTSRQIQSLKAEAAEELEGLRLTWQEKTKELGVNVNENFKGMKKDVIETVAALKEETKTKFVEMTEEAQRVIKETDWVSLGYDIIEGLNKGIDERKHIIISSMKSLARQALREARKTLGIQSPSKEFAEIGKQTVMGMVQGVERYSGMAVSAVGDMGRNTINSLSDTFDRILDILNSDVDLQPVIKPVIDLDDARAELRSLDSEIVDIGGYDTIRSVARAMRKRNNPIEVKDEVGDGDTTIHNDFVVYATVRDDDDTRKISEGLYKLQNRTNRNRGVVL